MPRVTQTVWSEAIYNGLPTFPEHNGKKYTAIVTGANGISGSEIVNVLSESPERWETIYALSRKPPVNNNPHVKTLAADFLSSTPEELAEKFQKEGIKADYIFFTSYLQPPLEEGAGLWSNTDALEQVNVTLLNNFLSALSIANIIPKRFLLQTGGKHYALHIGPATVPNTEDTPAERVPHPNFYFAQEDSLSAWAEKHNTAWAVSRPGFILGANPTAFINISYALAIYASVQKELGLKLDFPADVSAWDANKDNTTAKLLAYFSEWAVLTPSAANETFNITDDSPFSYGRFWPEVAGWYGIEAAIPEQDESKYTTITLPANPPPRGFGGPGILKVTFTFDSWAQRPEVKAAWESIQEREGLEKRLDPWGEGRGDVLKNVFATLDAEILGGWSRTQTMDKAKRLGWHGHVRTANGFKDTIEKMAALKMVPRL